MEAVSRGETALRLSAALDPADVVRLRLWRAAIPLLTARVAAHGTESSRQTVVVEVELASGAVGWGECVALAEPTYTEEWIDGAWLFLREQLVPAVLGGRGRSLVGHPMAHFAVETALVDARLREVGVNLAEALGGERLTLARTQVIAMVGPGGPERFAASLDPTAALVKLKVSPGADVEPLAALRRVGVPALAADANGSYAGAEPGHLRWLDELGLVYLEQPRAADDLAGHRLLASVVSTPLALDESLRQAGDVTTAIELGAAAVLNIKPARLGSFAASCRALEAAARAGLGAFIGGMYELGIGRAAALAVAARSEANLPTDLGPSSAYVAEDLTEPHRCDGAGRMVVPRGPGLGVEVDRERLGRCSLASPLEFRR